jgi:hydroxyethylthiazole kinase-like uncharacterized protein yjeF
MKSGTPLNRTALKANPLPAVIDGGKETKGRILVVAGSREVPGAALLTATAAMRAGAGKLRIATVDSVAPYIGVAMPEAMVIALPEHRDGGFARSAAARIAELSADADAIVAGPGIEANAASDRIVAALLKAPAALALDAALLHALSTAAKAERDPPPILLPHAGELASLLDCEESEIAADPIDCGLRAAKRFCSIVLVKGVISHVVHPHGRAWTYKGGAPGLGVSGSGDVLAGIVGGLLSRSADPLAALLWGVWLHGEAGAALARKVGPIGFLAREIAAEIPALLPR